jgi:hypothetical protein
MVYRPVGTQFSSCPICLYCRTDSLNNKADLRAESGGHPARPMVWGKKILSYIAYRLRDCLAPLTKCWLLNRAFLFDGYSGKCTLINANLCSSAHVIRVEQTGGKTRHHSDHVLGSSDFVGRLPIGMGSVEQNVWKRGG